MMHCGPPRSEASSRLGDSSVNIKIRRTCAIIEERREEAGRAASHPLRRVAAVAIVENPYAGGYVADLKPMIDASVSLGRTMAELTLDVFGQHEIQSYGKGAIVGMAGEQEHANALLTSAFANPIRVAIGGGDAWISSFTKKGGPGTLIDVPMNHKDDLWVRSHYDGMSIVVSDAPMPDEIAVIFCVASGGRLNARVGGLTHEEVMAQRKKPMSAI
jgi:amino acid synthesis protein